MEKAIGLHRRHKRPCAVEIKEILAEHSPLTISMIQKMTDPPMEIKSLRQSLGILRKKGEVDMLIGDSKNFYYQLSGISSGNLSEKFSKRPLLRRAHWFHNQWCEFWISQFRKKFPNCQVVREHDVGASEIAREILLTNGELGEVLPDFLVILPKEGTFERIGIAFEIERTRKSNARILQKLKKYSEETRVDGLIYVCDSTGLGEIIRRLYQEKLQAKSQRVRHYGNHFFLFSDSMSATSNPFSRLFNASGDPVSLEQWCMQLRSANKYERRDSKF